MRPTPHIFKNGGLFVMKKLFRMRRICVLALMLLLAAAMAAPAYAAAEDQMEPAAQEEAAEENTVGLKSIAVALAIGIAAGGGGIGMGLATAKSAESIARQPEAEGKVRTTLMLGLVFIETAIIYALLVVILIIFVL